MGIHFATISTVLVCALCLVPCSGVAQTPQVGVTELARARALLDLSRAELSAEQFALLSRRLAAAETAYAELTVVARGGQAVTTVVEGGAAASSQTTATGRALLMGAAELLPLLLLLWPATAHAPGTEKETPEVRAARSKAEESLRALAQAAREVDRQRAATMAKPTPKDSDGCTKFAESGTGGRERRCHYKCGNQNICVRVDGSQQCPEGPAGPLSDIKFRKLAGLPRCPPVETLAR